MREFETVRPDMHEVARRDSGAKKPMPSAFTWLPSQTFEPKRYRPENVGNWSGHLPFAHDLTVAIRPSLFVELGTHLGESYFGFCQAVAENQIPCLAYAVDNWVGEAHAGFYDEAVYEEVAAYNQANYRKFSYLVRSLFDDAIGNFADGSIDLLHIDGLHTFESVSHDFYNWLPKVKPGGIVLLHDIAVRHLDFGVWKLWDELKGKGRTFEFHHNWGLGVFQKPGTSRPDSESPEAELLKAMFGGDEKTREQIRRYYSLSAIELEWKHLSDSMLRLKPGEEKHRFQVYVPSADGYRENRSHALEYKSNRWECLRMELPEGVTEGLLRLDFTDVPAIVEVRGIFLRSAVDQKVLWSATGAEIGDLTPGGTLILLRTMEGNGAYRFLSYGEDPQLYLPPLDAKQFDQPLTLEIWVRLQTNLGALLPLLEVKKELEAIKEPRIQKAPTAHSDGEMLESARRQNAEAIAYLESQHAAATDGLKLQHVQGIEALKRQQVEAVESMNSQHEKTVEHLKAQFEKEREALSNELKAVKAQWTATQISQEKLAQDVNRKQTKIYLLEDFQNALPEAEKRTLQLEQKYKGLEKSYDELQTSYRALLKRHEEAESTLSKVLHSQSWRLTAPVRRTMELLRGQ